MNNPEGSNQWRLAEWFPDLAADRLSQLQKLGHELVRFQNALNLVSHKSIATMDQLHFSDSILASRLIRKDMGSGSEIFDFGSGNGFPGLVFAILFAEVKVKLVDLDQRKIEYLKHCVAALGLKNVECLNVGVEALPQSSVKFAMCRGLASVSKALLMARKPLAVGGLYYHLKSEEWATEIAQIPTQLCSFWLPSLLAEYRLPKSEIRFAVVKSQRIGSL